MKIIFLDVDGVLNCQFTKERANNGCIGIDPEKVKLLKQIVDATGALIVLSSTWRSHPRDRQEVMGELAKFDLELFDITPDYHFRTERGKEVQDWLREHPEVTKFVILDDENDFTMIMKHLVQTSFELDGLTLEHVERAIRHLN